VSRRQRHAEGSLEEVRAVLAGEMVEWDRLVEDIQIAQ